MTIQPGDRIPQSTLTTMGENKPVEITTHEIFSGRNVLMFAVPGAFTPTCSARHLPGYIDLAAEYHERGIDSIACMAVNDVFVMDAFGTAHRAQASTHGVARFAEQACAGPLLAGELEALGKALLAPARPLVAIVGGSKVSTKLDVLDALAGICSHAREQVLDVAIAIADQCILSSADRGQFTQRRLIQPRQNDFAECVAQETAASVRNRRTGIGPDGQYRHAVSIRGHLARGIDSTLAIDPVGPSVRRGVPDDHDLVHRSVQAGSEKVVHPGVETANVSRPGR